MSLSGVELLLDAADHALRRAEAQEAFGIERLQDSSANRYINMLRRSGAERAMIAVGVFSIFEARAQDLTNWNRTLEKLQRELQNAKQEDLAERLWLFGLAINVLKHGEGRSHQALLQARERLPFAVRQSDELFAEEGDVAEPEDLILADEKFVRECCDVIGRCWAFLGTLALQPAWDEN